MPLPFRPAVTKAIERIVEMISTLLAAAPYSDARALKMSAGMSENVLNHEAQLRSYGVL